MPFDEKMLKMRHHWIKHNEDHVLNYRNWAEKAKTNDLEEAAEMSLGLNDRFRKTIASIGDE